ncbi:hypothetical protein IQ254_10655 [Nodosilinea sp. LEGE 07088]|uniref:hypothetical protein n=1 Tax=Nodosilinea sp. LEGE 07088 TaxID=2777968 RepID=UPI00187F228C|nr:hypothetical protein [Nodosilinea sp. LEGE 07088]MBE9137669.1 hypothetical protein [Nodosilinea sp. LEGE 07088]
MPLSLLPTFCIAVLVTVLTIVSLAYGKSDRDEFPGRRQGGGGHAYSDQDDRDAD